MSWRIQTTGHAGAVEKELRAQAESQKLNIESETAVREHAIVVIAAAAADMPPRSVVRVEASGSCHKNEKGEKFHACEIKFAHLYGFVEHVDPAA